MESVGNAKSLEYHPKRKPQQTRLSFFEWYTKPNNKSKAFKMPEHKEA